MRLRYLTVIYSGYSRERTLQYWDEKQLIWCDVLEFECTASEYQRANDDADWDKELSS